MSKLPTLAEHPVAPKYSHSSPNERISFGTLPTRISAGTVGATVDADFSVAFLPRENVSIRVSCDGKINIPTIVDDTITVSIDNRNVDFDAIFVHAQPTSISYTPSRTPLNLRPPATDIASATFHLFNWPRTFGPDDYVIEAIRPHFKSSSHHGRIILQDGPWQIVICETDQTEGISNQLKVSGGYALTHVGRIDRSDNARFTSEELTDLLEKLTYFLSFAASRWRSPDLVVGTNFDGDEVFQEIGLRHVTEGAWYGGGWFDFHHAEMLQQLFPGFCRLWKLDRWREPLQHAIYFYLSSAVPGGRIHVDTGLILCQAAIEALAWSYCVVDQRMISESAFEKKLGAPDKFRMLMTVLGLPKEIPASMQQAFSRKGHAWSDALEVLTDYRNKIVHPKGVPPATGYADAWRLAMWYIEVAILRICGYTGKYSNRLADRWVGDIEDVPWS